jgi:superfamily II DNA/RNA helicase
MKAIHHSLYDIQKCASRLTRKMMSEYFSENHVDATAFSMNEVATHKIQAVYDWLDRELQKLWEHTETYGDCILSVILEARQRIELLKVPLFCELIEDDFDEGNSVVCFVNFTRTLEAISTKLKQRKDLAGLIGYIHGHQRDKDREQDIADFMADRKRIILANQAAGGIAIDLHDLNGNFPRTTKLSPTFSAIQLLQALGRIDRVGTLTPCFQTLVYVAGTIEERAVFSVQSKINNLEMLNAGDLSMGLKLVDTHS